MKVDAGVILEKTRFKVGQSERSHSFRKLDILYLNEVSPSSLAKNIDLWSEILQKKI